VIFHVLHAKLAQDYAHHALTFNFYTMVIVMIIVQNLIATEDVSLHVLQVIINLQVQLVPLAHQIVNNVQLILNAQNAHLIYILT
jgi:hypothetical protein